MKTTRRPEEIAAIIILGVLAVLSAVTLAQQIGYSTELFGGWEPFPPGLEPLGVLGQLGAILGAALYAVSMVLLFARIQLAALITVAVQGFFIVAGNLSYAFAGMFDWLPFVSLQYVGTAPFAVSTFFITLEPLLVAGVIILIGIAVRKNRLARNQSKAVTNTYCSQCGSPAAGGAFCVSCGTQTSQPVSKA